MLWCVKDKIEAGCYVVTCEIIDRLGGTPFNYEADKHLKELEKFWKNIKKYEQLKREFLMDEKIENIDDESYELLKSMKNEEGEEEKDDSDLEEKDLEQKYNKLNFKL